jgi:uncharacterized membrane protein
MLSSCGPVFQEDGASTEVAGGVMHTLLYLSAGTLNALVNLASFAIALGTLAAAYTQSLQTALLVALAALVSGSVGFGYSLWVTLKSPRKNTISA